MALLLLDGAQMLMLSSLKTLQHVLTLTLVLFDGHIPTLTGLDGDMWASQLLTIQVAADPRKEITFWFHDTPTFTRVEVLMFNCPQWELGVERIIITDQGETIIAEAKSRPSTVSCDSLVQICLLPANTPRNDTRVLILEFVLSDNSHWVHLAEVTFWNNNPSSPPDIVVTKPPSLPATLPFTGNTTHTADTASTSTPKRDATVTAISVFFLLLLLLVGVVVVVLVLWRCRHQHTAKEEASHTSSQTHAHPVVSLCEETGQVQYIIQVTDQDSLYSSIPAQLGQERKEANKDGILHTEEDEMGGYDVIPLMLKPSEGETKVVVNSDNDAKLKDVSTASPEMEMRSDYTYTTIDKKMGGSN